MAETIVTDPVSDGPARLLTWTSIFSGWLVALGFAWVLYVLGLAVGFSALNVNDPEATARGIGIGTAAWIVLTWAVSLFLGGLFATWVDGRSNSNVGTLHGVAVWGLASAVTVLLAAIGFSNVLQGAGSLLGGATHAAASAGARSGNASDAQGRVSSLLAAQVRRAQQGTGSSPAGQAATVPAPTQAGQGPAAPSSSAAGSVDSSAAVATDLLAGRNDDAKARLMADSGMSAADADRTMQSLAPQVEQYKAKIKEAADSARRYTAAAMWITFLGSVISLIAAALGGAFGAQHLHRVHDWPAATLRRPL